MTFDREEYSERIRSKLRGEGKKRMPELRRAVQAATAQENLTASAEWNYFVTQLEAMKQEAEKARDEAQRILNDIQVVEQSDMMKAKLMRVAAESAVDVLNRVVALPAEIIANGQKAKALVKDLETDG